MSPISSYRRAVPGLDRGLVMAGPVDRPAVAAWVTFSDGDPRLCHRRCRSERFRGSFCFRSAPTSYVNLLNHT